MILKIQKKKEQIDEGNACMRVCTQYIFIYLFI